jgi:hypothetical protein
MPTGRAVPAFDHTWLALVLTFQVFVGALLGIAAQFVLAIGVIFYVLPWMGLELLDTARAVAEFDLPIRVLGLWWGDHSWRRYCAAVTEARRLHVAPQEPLACIGFAHRPMVPAMP